MSNLDVVTKMTPDEKLSIIRSGKRKRSLTGVKENKNILFENKGGKFVAVETERKFEEAGVTKKKQNFIMFESKLGTEKDVDFTKISGPKKDVKFMSISIHFTTLTCRETYKWIEQGYNIY